MISLSIFFGIISFQISLSHYISILLIPGKPAIQLLFERKHRINQCMALPDDFPCFIQWGCNICCFSNPKIILSGKPFGQAGFPKSMDANLVGELTVIIFGSVQRDMGIANVVTEIGGMP